MTQLTLPQNPRLRNHTNTLLLWMGFAQGTGVTVVQGTLVLVLGVRRTSQKLQRDLNKQGFKASFPWGIWAAAFGARGRLTWAGTEALSCRSQPHSPQP